jgi:hypothetical protein
MNLECGTAHERIADRSEVLGVISRWREHDDREDIAFPFQGLAQVHQKGRTPAQRKSACDGGERTVTLG